MSEYPRCVASLRDLEQFGVDMLTGEADNLGFRILCDLTALGRRIVAETYGLRESGFASNWNSGSAIGEHVASFMLPRDEWRAIAVVGLIMTGSEFVVEVDNGALYGMSRDDYRSAECEWEENKVVMRKPAQLRIAGVLEDWPSCYGVPKRTYSGLQGHPCVGTRNTHAMSGRST